MSRYDEEQFVNFTEEDGLASGVVRGIYRDPDGVMWFGTWGGGLSRYDGREFTNFTTEDGLVHNMIWAICSDPDGMIWIGAGGLARYRWCLSIRRKYLRQFHHRGWTGRQSYI